MDPVRILEVVLTVLLYSAGTYGEEPEITDPALKEAVADYQSAVQTAREKFLPQFEKVISAARNNKTAAVSDKARIVAELEGQRDQFLQDGTIPLNPVLLKLAQPYARAMDQAALKLRGHFKKAAKAKVDAGKPSEATALLTSCEKLIVGEGAELIGHWRLSEGIGAHGFSEQYVIQKRLGQWSVERTFYEPSGTKAGASSAVDLSYAAGALTYTDHFTRKPKAEWHDRADMKIWEDSAKPGSLKLKWAVGSGQSDQITLVRVN